MDGYPSLEGSKYIASLQKQRDIPTITSQLNFGAYILPYLEVINYVSTNKVFNGSSQYFPNPYLFFILPLSFFFKDNTLFPQKSYTLHCIPIIHYITIILAKI